MSPLRLWRCFPAVLALAVFISNLPGGVISQTPTKLEQLLKECEDITSSQHFCLSTLRQTGVISIYRKDTDFASTGMIAKIGPVSAAGDLVDVTLIGGNSPDVTFIAFSIGDRARASMGAGGPALLCMARHGDKAAKLYYLGKVGGGFDVTISGDPSLTSMPIGAKNLEDFFKDTIDAVEETNVNGVKAISCDFKITSKMWKLDFTELDLKKNPYNVVFSQGKVDDGQHQQEDPDTLRAISHTSYNRWVSTSRYFLHKPANDQSYITEYLKCGVTDYCVGAGYDGCGTNSFDCKYFLKFKRENNMTIKVTMRSTTFKTFMGVGFSSSANLIDSDPLARWNNLKLIVICEVGAAPTVIAVECDQQEKDSKTPCTSSSRSSPLPSIGNPTNAVHSTIMNSLDELVDVLGCEFDLVFSGEYLDMMQLKGTRLHLGGNSGGTAAWYSGLFPGNEDSVHFGRSENTALLKVGDTELPPKGVWEIARQHGNRVDPIDLNPSDPDCGSKSTGTLNIVAVALGITFVLNNLQGRLAP